MFLTKAKSYCALLAALLAVLPVAAQTSLPDRLRSLNAELRADSAPPAQSLRERSVLLIRMMREDPARAADLVLSARERQRLVDRHPGAAQLLEESGRWSGQLVPVAVDDFQNGASFTEFHLIDGQRQYQVSFVDRPGTASRCASASLEGYRLGDTILATAAGTNEASNSPACIATGEQKTAVILASSPTAPLPPALTASHVQNVFFGVAGPSVDGYVRDASYGKAWLSGNVFGPFVLDADYGCADNVGLVQAAIRAADASIDFRNFNRIVVVTPRPPACSYASASIGCASLSSTGEGVFTASYAVLDAAYLTPSAAAATGVAAHALGHNFGLGHSNTRDYSARALGAINEAGIDVENGDGFSVMGMPGAAGQPLLGHFASQHKAALGWLAPGEFAEVENGGTFTLNPYSAQSAGLKALRIRRGSGNWEWLWVEYRQPSGLYDSTLTSFSPVAYSGALIRHDRPRDVFGATFLLTFYPAQAPNDFRYAPLVAGAKWDDPYSDLTLEAIAAGPALQIRVSYRPGACEYQLQPPSRTVPAAGGRFWFNVLTGCGYQASSGAGFVSIVSGASGAGNGQVYFDVAPNAGSTQRSATIAVADQTFVLTQEAAAWQVSFTPPVGTVAAGGGSSTVNVSITGTAPGWSAVSNVPWVHPAQIAGSPGNGSVTYTVAPNLGLTSRSAVLTIAGAPFTIHQAAAASAPAGRVYTIAGLNPPAAGPATAVPLRSLVSMDLDSQGNLYIAEQWSHRIRKITPEGLLSTIAGNGLPQSTGNGGPAAAAHVHSPVALIVDAQGNVVFADMSGLRKISPAGTISSAATGTVWSDRAVAARGPDGSVYITGVNEIKRITPAGQVVPFAGTGIAGSSGDGGLATSAQLNTPLGIAVDSAGRVFISDSGNHRIRMVDTNGVITAFAGTGTVGFSGDNGPAAAAQLWVPGSLAFDPSGALVVVDGGNRLRRIAEGTINTLAGGVDGQPADSGPAASSPLGLIQSVRFLPDGSYFFVSNDFKIRKVDVQGQIAVYAGNQSNIGDAGPANSAFLHMSEVEGRKLVRDREGNIYIADQHNLRVRRISLDGTIATVAGSGVEGSGGDGYPALQTAINPVAVAINPAGELYFVEYARIRKVLPNGVISTVAGTGIPGYSGDGGAATSAQISASSAIAFDALGNLYFGTLDNRIRRVTPGGIISTFAGTGASGSTGDGGQAAAAAIGEVADIAVDGDGNVFFIGGLFAGGPALRKIDQTGIIGTINVALQPLSVAIAADGSLYVSNATCFARLSAAGATLYSACGGSNITEGAPFSDNKTFSPSSLTLDSSGALLFAEPWSQRIRKVVFGFALGQTSADHARTAGMGSVQVTAPSSSYVWTASSSASWLHPDPSAKTGSGTLGYTVDVNNTLFAREAVLIVGDQLFVIRQQAGVPSPPALAISKTHSGALTPGQSAAYTIVVSNGSTSGPTSGTVTVTEIPPSTLTVISMSGSGWTCAGLTCTRSDALDGNSAYPAISVSANVAVNAASSVVNTATVSGGGSAAATATDIGQISGALRFVPIAPCRIADTRTMSGPFGGPAIGKQKTRSFDIPAAGCGIPRTAAAYALNVTVVPMGPLGYLTVWPSGQGQPTASTLNSHDGRVKANAAIVAAGAGNAVSVYATEATHLVLDINGYFVPATDATALTFYPLAPCRLVDTRAANGLLGGPTLTGGSSRTFPVLSSACNIPASAQAYSLNMTVVPKQPLSYLTTWPTGQMRPTVSTLNAHTGAITANAAIVPAGNGGAIDTFVTEATDLVIDINGYFAPAAPGGLSLYGASPCRVIDTREPNGAPAPLNRIDIPVAASVCAVPSVAQAYVFNATVVPADPLGYLTLWPGGADAMPLVSTLNASDATVTSNMAIVPASGGAISAFVSNRSHLVLDTSGYFAP